MNMNDMERVRTIVRTYLRLSGRYVSRSEILRVASRNGINRSIVYKVLQKMQNVDNYDDCDIASYYGHSPKKIANSRWYDKEQNLGQKDLWFCYLNMPTEEKRHKIEDLEWFDSLR